MDTSELSTETMCQWESGKNEYGDRFNNKNPHANMILKDWRKTNRVAIQHILKFVTPDIDATMH